MDKNSVSERDANGDGISCLAFQLWEKAGCPEGRDLELWLGAESRLLAPQRPEAAGVESAAAKPSSPSRAWHIASDAHVELAQLDFEPAQLKVYYR